MPIQQMAKAQRLQASEGTQVDVRVERRPRHADTRAGRFNTPALRHDVGPVA
jgi:hypothetical protein